MDLGLVVVEGKVIDRMMPGHDRPRPKPVGIYAERRVGAPVSAGTSAHS
jgi:hypothetical protein